MPTRFRDCACAGHLLASRLEAYAGRMDVLVLALPRGGVPVAYEVPPRHGGAARRLRGAQAGGAATRSSPWGPSPRVARGFSMRM
jgi:hypothetical protein